MLTTSAAKHFRPAFQRRHSRKMKAFRGRFRKFVAKAFEEGDQAIPVEESDHVFRENSPRTLSKGWGTTQLQIAAEAFTFLNVSLANVTSSKIRK